MDNGNFQRKMFKGDWKCGKCGKPITELPFEPKADRLNELKCRDCYRESRGGSFSGGGGRF